MEPTAVPATEAPAGAIQVTKEYLKGLLKEVLGPELAEFRADQERKGQEILTNHMGRFFANAKDGVGASAPPEKGAAFTRVVRAMAAAKGDVDRAKAWLKKGYGDHAAGAIAMIETGEETGAGLAVKALGSNVFGSGGALVTPGSTNEVIELLRPASVVRSLGPKIVPLDGGSLPIPRLAGGATATYAGENAARNASEGTTNDVNLVARELGVIVPLSNKLMMVASVDVDALVRDDAIAAIGQREDLAFLRGDGAANTPVGMRNWAAAANIFAIGAGNTAATITTGVKAIIAKLINANVRMLKPAWIWSPITELRLMSLLDTNNQYIFREEMAAGTFWGAPFRRTTQMLDAEVFYVDMADAMLGQLSTITIDASATAAYNDSTGTVQAAFSRNQTVIRLIENHDFGMRHAESVSVGTGVDWS